MQEVFEKIIEKLEELKKAEIEREDLCDEEGCGDGEEIYEDGKSQGRFEQVVRIIEIVKQEAEQYEECYKDCGECEAYDKEKYHCPKFCKVIKETVKEIEENHNIKGKWEMTYRGMKKDVNTGLMISAYNCKCSVCGWETGNQGTRFNYCPNCGAKMDEVNKPKGE